MIIHTHTHTHKFIYLHIYMCVYIVLITMVIKDQTINLLAEKLIIRLIRNENKLWLQP